MKKTLESEKKRYEDLEKEKECTFKNLFDEMQSLKKQNDILKKAEFDSKRKEMDFKEEMENLRRRLKT
jgi:hypothetical protein